MEIAPRVEIQSNAISYQAEDDRGAEPWAFRSERPELPPRRFDPSLSRRRSAHALSRNPTQKVKIESSMNQTPGKVAKRDHDQKQYFAESSAPETENQQTWVGGVVRDVQGEMLLVARQTDHLTAAGEEAWLGVTSTLSFPEWQDGCLGSDRSVCKMLFLSGCRTCR